jgi:hypothetical protein
MVRKIEILFQTLYNYSKSLKMHLEFMKLAELMKTKGAKILKIVLAIYVVPHPTCYGIIQNIFDEDYH